MKWLNLRVKFTLATVVLVVAMVTVLSYELLTRLRPPIEDLVLKKGEALLANLAANAREGILTDDELLIAQLLDQLKQEPSVVMATVADAKWRVIAHSDPATKRGMPFKDLPRPQSQHIVLSRDMKVRNQLVGHAMLVLSRRDIDDSMTSVQAVLAKVRILLLLVGVLGAMLMVEFITRPIKILTRGVELVGSGKMDHRIPVSSSDEIGELAGAFNAMTGRLRQAQEELIEQDRLKQELRIAKEIQESLLPKEFPQIDGYELGAFYQSAKEIGGDYYDFFWVDHRRLGLVIADVSGKGVPGALGMTVTRNILRSKAIGKGWPSQVLTQTNVMVRSNLKRGMFVTMFYMLLDPQEKTLICSNAGHLPLLVFRKGGGYEVVDPPGMALGLGDAREFERVLSDITVQLYDGDMVMLYSDGIPEAVNSQGEEFGERRLIQQVDRMRQARVSEVLAAIQSQLAEFTAGVPQHDDMTMVVLRVGAV